MPPAFLPNSLPLTIAEEIAAVVSRKKQALSIAASFGVSGGTRRVFTHPGRGALVITASAQKPRGLFGRAFESRGRRTAFIRQAASASWLFANSVLVPSVLPGLDLFPRLRRKEPFERLR